MREIKFRGREVDTGRVVYGYYLESAITSWIRDNETKTYVQVDPETVAQLVGHDAEGKEIYEGDTVTDIENADYVVESSVLMFTPDRKSIYIGKTSTFNLVEATS